MIDRNRWTLARAATALAFVTLALAALLARADRDGVISLAAVGHVLWGMVLARGVVLRHVASGSRRCTVTAATVASFGVAEAVGAGLCLRAGDPDLACWFAIGFSFALAGLATAVREKPGDTTFSAQLLFHGVLLLPLAALVAQAVLTGGAPSRSTISPSGPLLRTAVLVGSVLVPALIATLAVAVVIDLAQPRAQRKDAWSALVLNELALVLILSRWSLELR